MTESHIYKLLTPPDWQTAKAGGHTQTTLDKRDGYVHLSTRAQVGETARLHYGGQKNVRLLEFAVSDLSPLKWEESRGGQLFPHLFAPLPIALATRQWTLQLDEQDSPKMPEDL